jgi:SAM-dependent methyltransferase
MPNAEKLGEFVDWCAKHITGDEKGQAQIFLDRFFQALGQPGCLDVGGQTEFRVRKSGEDGGGVSFADYVWKPVVLIEMKKRGEKLERHRAQAERYWTRLVPNRPRYVILCNFDELWVYDFDTQLDTPKDSVALTELPERWGPLAFLCPGDLKPTFGNDHVAVTRDAADHLAAVFRRLVAPERRPPVDRATAQKFVLQMLVALFSEDIGLLDKYFVAQLLEDCHSPADSHDLIGGLFEAMNQSKRSTGGRFKSVPYFNGGLFAEPARIELQDQELVALRKAATFDWSKVQPDIFGTLFQHSMDADERHAYGAHFTHPSDIMKIVGPTIVEPWREQIEGAKTYKRLRELRDRLQTFRVLDPACGSGNFLYIGYRELKRLEARIYERIDAEFPKFAQTDQIRFSYLTAQNFYGLDIQPFAVEIAKVTMMIARKLAIDELHITEQALPLDNLDRNFLVADALLTPDGRSTEWPPADVIIGNPPFLGAKRLKPERGPDYVNAVRKAYADVPGMADYCVYWIRRAADHLPDCTAADPLAGRAGLVGTQNIRNNQSRVGGLDHVAKTGTIVEAVENQPWSGEANVHVSIANWVKTQDADLLPEIRKLWFKVEPSALAKKSRKRGEGSAAKDYELDVRECDAINSALSDKADASAAEVLPCNRRPKRVFQGVTPGHDAFVLDRNDLSKLASDGTSQSIVHPYLIGRELVSGDGTPERLIIDFQQRTILEAQAFPSAFRKVKDAVLPDRLKKGRKGERQGREDAIAPQGLPRPLVAPVVEPRRILRRSQRSWREVYRVLTSHQTANLRISGFVDMAKRCRRMLPLRRRLQFRVAPVTYPLALVHHKVQQAEVGLPLHT